MPVPPPPRRSAPPPPPRRSAPPPAPSAPPEPPIPEPEVDPSGARYAAKKDDKVMGLDMHLITSSAGVTSAVPHRFAGPLTEELSEDVLVDDQPIAVVGSVAQNDPPHVPQGGSFAKPPKNRGEVIVGSGSCFANDKPIARVGDAVKTCNDPEDLPTGVVIGKSSVLVGS